MKDSPKTGRTGKSRDTKEMSKGTDITELAGRSELLCQFKGDNSCLAGLTVRLSNSAMSMTEALVVPRIQRGKNQALA